MSAVSIDSNELNPTADEKGFSVGQAQRLVRSMSKPVAWIYWTDFLVSIISGHVLFNLLLYSDKWLQASIGWEWTIKIGLYVAVVLLFMRCAMFTHELVHLPKEGFTGFRFAWNLLCGIPFLIPSFTYYPHLDHHRRKSYGTHEDGEYLSLSHQSPRMILVYMLLILVTPLAAFFRFLVLTPISWFLPIIKKWTFNHASTMVMDVTYYRPHSGPRVQQIRFIQELACLGVCLFIALRNPLQGYAYDPLWLQAYLVSIGLLTVNNIRTLGAHRWTGDGSELTFHQQLLDSCDYPYRPWFTELWGPIGTRYHATHHLFPSIPYHNLGKAHRALMAGLPADSLFRETVKVSLLGEIANLWQRASSSQRQRAAKEKLLDHKKQLGHRRKKHVA
jgi:fatty acid desaturase